MKPSLLQKKPNSIYLLAWSKPMPYTNRLAYFDARVIECWRSCINCIEDKHSPYSFEIAAVGSTYSNKVLGLQ